VDVGTMVGGMNLDDLYEKEYKPVLEMTRMPDGSYEWNAPTWRVRSLDKIRRRAIRGIVTILVTIVSRHF
jgi:hypothetical protein